MKHITRVFAFALVLVMLVTTLASCGTTLSGTYADGTGLLSYTFEGNKVTLSVLGIEIEGTYKIDGDHITLKISEEAVAPLAELGITAEDISKTFDFEKDGDTIKIDGEVYTKKD